MMVDINEPGIRLQAQRRYDTAAQTQNYDTTHTSRPDAVPTWDDLPREEQDTIIREWDEGGLLTHPETFSDISNERQWGWGEEIEVLWDLIHDKGLGDEAVRYARRQADQEIAEEVSEAHASALQRLVDMIYGARNLRSPSDDHDTRLAIESLLVDTGIEPTR